MNGLGRTTHEKITEANLLEKYDSLPWGKLSEAVNNFGKQFKVIHSYYKEFPESQKMVDTGLALLNQELANLGEGQKPAPKPRAATKPKPAAKKPVAKKPRTRVAKKRVAKKPSLKVIKKPSTTAQFNYVYSIPDELKFVRRFVKLNGKEVAGAEIRRIHSGLSKLIVQGKLREHAPVALDVHQFLSKNVKGIKDTDRIPVDIEEKPLQQIILETGGYKVYPWVSLLTSFYNIQGTAPDKKRAANLRDRIKRYLGTDRKMKVNYLKEAHKSLDAYANGKTSTVAVASRIQGALNGFLEGCGCQLSSGLNGIISSQEVAQKVYRPIGLRGEWQEMYGDPTQGWVLMVYGGPGQGKSTHSLQFANYLATGANVMFVSTEEIRQTGNGMAISSTLKDKLERSGGQQRGLHFAADVEGFDHSDYDFVFIDSVNGGRMDYHTFTALRAENPLVSYVLVFQLTNKEGSYRGSQEWEHEADTVVKVEQGIASVEKNRFGNTGYMKVF